MAYVIRGVSESLFGKPDAIKLGIVKFHPEGSESVNRVTATQKEPSPDPRDIVRWIDTDGNRRKHGDHCEGVPTTVLRTWKGYWCRSHPYRD